MKITGPDLSTWRKGTNFFETSRTTLAQDQIFSKTLEPVGTRTVKNEIVDRTKKMKISDGPSRTHLDLPVPNSTVRGSLVSTDLNRSDQSAEL